MTALPHPFTVSGISREQLARVQNPRLNSSVDTAPSNIVTPRPLKETVAFPPTHASLACNGDMETRLEALEYRIQHDCVSRLELQSQLEKSHHRNDELALQVESLLREREDWRHETASLQKQIMVHEEALSSVKEMSAVQSSTRKGMDELLSTVHQCTENIAENRNMVQDAVANADRFGTSLDKLRESMNHDFLRQTVKKATEEFLKSRQVLKFQKSTRYNAEVIASVVGRLDEDEKTIGAFQALQKNFEKQNKELQSLFVRFSLLEAWSRPKPIEWPQAGSEETRPVGDQSDGSDSDVEHANIETRCEQLEQDSRSLRGIMFSKNKRLLQEVNDLKHQMSEIQRKFKGAQIAMDISETKDHLQSTRQTQNVYLQNMQELSAQLRDLKSTTSYEISRVGKQLRSIEAQIEGPYRTQINQQIVPSDWSPHIATLGIKKLHSLFENDSQLHQALPPKASGHRKHNMQFRGKGRHVNLSGGGGGSSLGQKNRSDSFGSWG